MSNYQQYDDETRRKLERFDEMQEKGAARRSRRKEHRQEIAETFRWLTPGVLAEALDRELPEYAWRTQGSLTGLGTGRQAVDIVGRRRSGGHVVYVEVEGGQSRPVSNTVKIWRHTQARSVAESITFVQLFSPYYGLSEGVHHTRMEEAVFIGQEAQKATGTMRYLWLLPDDWPAKLERLGDFVRRLSELIQPATQSPTVDISRTAGQQLRYGGLNQTPSVHPHPLDLYIPRIYNEQA